MPATSLPPVSALEGLGTTPTSATFRAAIGDVRRYLAGLLGTTGELVDAIGALGLNKVSGDCLQTRVFKPAVTGTGTGASGTVVVSTCPAFTPKSAASIILVKCWISSDVDQNTGSLSFEIKKDAVRLGFVYPHYQNAGGRFSLKDFFTNSALTPLIFSLDVTGAQIGPVDVSRVLWEISEYVA